MRVVAGHGKPLLAVLTTIAVALSCHSCADVPKGETVGQIADAYDALVRDAGRTPTAATVVVKACDLVPMALTVPPALHAALVTSSQTLEGEMYVLARLPQREPDPDVVAQAKTELKLTQRAFEQVQEGKGLPSGLVPCDLRQPEDCCPYRDQIRQLAMNLTVAVDLALYQRDHVAARDLAGSMLVVERALHHAPPTLCQLTRLPMAGLTNNAFLETAMTGDVAAADLEDMASDLGRTEGDPVTALRWILRIERAHLLQVFEQVRQPNSKEMRAVIEGSGATAKAVLRQLRKDRREAVELCNEYETALAAQARLPVLADYFTFSDLLGRLQVMPGMRSHPKSHRRLGLVGREFGFTLVMAPEYQERFLVSQARRRAAVVLLRILAFRKRHGRLPAAREVKSLKDPFRPGSSLVYANDIQRKRVGVYSQGWSTEKKAEKRMIGYWLVLE